MTYEEAIIAQVASAYRKHESRDGGNLKRNKGVILKGIKCRCTKDNAIGPA